ncbi:MAG TPA: aminotransferase class V-fold PLP-dependent enzyme [Acidobacteriaceae bacterium]|jgi:kynureninase|nr:aminotransferase class V-fold PLP-dependent enzyme [Acidobacteriaceae bacterium]
MTDALSESIGALGPGALTEASVQRHIFPLFAGVLANEFIYLANHSLGRPLDQTAEDLREAFTLWQKKLGDAWEAWLPAQESHRARIATLIGAQRADCIVPKTSAGQGLRTVLNALPGKPKVLTTRGEFDSVDFILKQYAAVGRIDLTFVELEEDGRFDVERLMDAVRGGQGGVDLVVVSQVMFMTGQIVPGLDELATVCHAAGARLLVDAFHAVGVIPVDVTAMGADCMIGGSYKYLRGGPGACFLYLSPEMLASGLMAPLDIGWFAKENPFLFARPEPPRFAAGGDAFLESTPSVFSYYQARAGQRFVLAVGVDRLRAYGLDRLRRLKQCLEDVGVAVEGADEDHGAFLTLQHKDAMQLAQILAEKGVHTDARSRWLRLCPDCLTLEEEMHRAAEAVASVLQKH